MMLPEISKSTELNRETKSSSKNLNKSFRSALSDRVKRGVTFPSLAGQEDEFFVNFLTTENPEAKPADLTASQQFDISMANLQTERMKKFIIQPGAATGRSAEQMLRVIGGVDPTMRAVMIGITGLRLFAAILPEIRSHPLLSSFVVRGSRDPKRELAMKDCEPGGVTSEQMIDLLNACSEYVVDCFCGPNDDLFQIASKCLVKLLIFDIEPIHQQGQRIALGVLR